MNTKSEDVVKNVELNQVESTSNEQRQTVKPIVISRRRLLRAGVAGIPVVLTMAGLAPAESIQTTPSAASGLVYGGNKVYNRFYDQRRSDGLVWTDHNGFVLLPEGGVKTVELTINTSNDSSGKTSIGPIDGTPLVPDSTTTPPQKTFTVSISKPSNLKTNAYHHKTGNWYTDLKVGNQSDDLLNYIKGLNLTVVDSSSSGGEVSNVTLSDENAEYTTNPNTAWYNSIVMGYTLADNSDTPEEYYALNQSNTTIDSVKYTAKISFEYKPTDEDYAYKCESTSIEITLKLEVEGIPAPTADDHGI